MTQTPVTPKPKPNPDDMLNYLPPFVSTAQAAVVSGLSEKTIVRRIKDGSLRATRLGPRVLRIQRDSLLEWLGAA